MNLTKIIVFSRKIHRFFVLVIVILTLIMTTTGGTMKYPELFPFIDQFTARSLHSTVSTVFALTLIVMMITGLFMYLYPWLQKITKKSSP